MVKRKRNRWPTWWDWELEFIPHVEKRMAKRHFTEIDLRRMMEQATGFRRDHIEDRWVIETRFRRERWNIIVEPIPEKETLEVITAYEAQNDE